MAPDSHKIFYKRKLPHYQLNNVTYFITLWLGDQSQHFNDFLDSSKVGPFWLGEDRIAKIVADAIRHRDQTDYDLIAFCIMPNHAHLLFASVVERDLSRSSPSERTEVRSTFPVTSILRLIKGSTARECNKLLNRTGAFWQHESYDHIIRSQKELNDSILYVLNNPVKAGLVSRWEEWK
jgi:REP element-mobilizing transposase RayT